ncbi:putative septum site-determining protein MinC (plasmid) [Leptotrichia wadei]|uniref:Putative septum site-determining protein MinC n=5 Tax=Leptotrichia wadei TaxID=157687 RepID=A0A7U6R035_9FUSO|nr:filamentous hemagglutinin N-terminal domain-containing protein [Leptotrichia wadei]BBM43908.1 putative septum site-determining protein MinC [Leptotrichia wadei]
MRGKSKILRKLTAALLLNVFSFNILADGLQVDPNSRYNTSLDRSQNGVPVVNISTPNGRGVSINEFLEYNVGREGQVLNNADNIGRSHLAGIINANPNLGPNQAANLILLQVNGANRSQIEGYIEALSRQKVNVILSNENGIYLNGAGTINIKNFIPTTGKVKLKDGDVIGIDVEKGRVVIGANGFDATNTDYVNVIAKAMELQGNLVGNKVDVTLGENTVDSSGTVTSKNGINSVAIDASNLGSMYAGQIKIVSTDKGAGVNSNGLIYSRDTKLEITADGKINVAKIKGNGIEINGTEYAQSELASSDKGININAAKIKLDGETQANEDINLNGNVENKSNIYTGGNLNTLDMINSGNINASGNITAKDFRNSLATVLSGGNFNVKNLDNSGNIQVSGITDINGKFDNTGALTSVKRISVLGNVASTGNILTNEDLTARNTVTSGTVAAKNLKVDNLTNDGKISANGNLLAKDIKNTGEILTNGNLTAKNVSSMGDITVVGKVSADSLKSSGSLRTNEDLSINGKFDNDGTVETSKNVAVSGDINNTGKILVSGNLSGKNTVSSGVIASKNVVVDNLKNDGKITAGENITAKKVTNTGDIAAAGTVSSDDMATSGTVKANKTVTVSGKLENDGTVETAEDVKVSGSIRNTGRIASNGDLTGKDTINSGTISSKNVTAGNLQNDGKIIANGDLKAKNVKNTKDITAVGTVSSDDLVTSGNVRANRKITVSGKLENSGAVETSKNISVAGNIKNDGRIAANDDLAGKNTENNGNIYVKNLEVNNLKNTGKVEGVNLKTDDIANSGDITAIGKVSGENIDNSGKLLANDTISAKNIKNATSSSKIAAGKGITGERIDNSGTFATNGDIKGTNSLVNSGTVDGKGIDILGADFVNSGKINADNIKANVTNTRNDGFIYSGKDIDLTTNTLINTKEITAVNNVNAANANVTNSGKIASNNRVLLDGSAIANTGEILSGEILMRNAQRFDNTGTIKGNNVELGINQDINLTGNLHGQHRLKISANNITNNGNTTGTGLIEINSNDFTNNRELASDTVIVNGRGEVVNNSMITGNNGKVSGRNITNNDLIAFDNYLEMNVQGKVQNNKGKAIYGGQALAIKANEIMNDEAEILGGNMDLNAAKITNNVGTIQSTGNITITSSDFQNIGRVSNLGSYEKYYETWDGRRLSEAEVLNGWIVNEPDFQHRSRDRGSVKRHQRSWLESMIAKHSGNSLLFSQYADLARAKLGQRRKLTRTNTPEVPGNTLTGKIDSRATTEYGKVLASGNITINSGNFKNRDSIISGGGLVNINATNFENSVTLGNAVQLKNGQEKLYLTYRHGSRRSSANGTYSRYLENGGIGYESGQPSIIEGAVVNVNAPNIIKNPIEAGNGKVLNNGGATGRALISSTSVGMNKGTSSANGQVQAAGNTLLSKVNSSFNGNSQVNGSTNLNNPVNNGFDRAIQIAGNNSGIKDIKNTGRIDVNPILSSAMFTTNMNPSSKYLLETRSRYISLGQYFGSDYFTSRVGYSEIWDRTRRLGDAYYENQLLTRSLAEKLGTSFINGKSNQELIQSMMDNAATEGTRLGLTVGQELTQDQINNLNEDIVWYVTKNVNGVEVLAPQVYLSSKTRESISDDTRNRVGGINGTYVKTKDFVNDGTKWGNGGVTYVEANTVRNETTNNLLSEISGDKTYISSVGNIENIGGRINGEEAVALISEKGNVINNTTKRTTGFNYGEYDKSQREEIASIGGITSKGTTFIKADSYNSVGGMLKTDHLALDVNSFNTSALSLSGQSTLGISGSNYSKYAETTHFGGGAVANSAEGRIGNLNLRGSSFIAEDTTGLAVGNVRAESVINTYDIESRQSNKSTFASNSNYIKSHQEENVASNLQLGKNAVITGNVEGIGSNIVLGENTFVGGKVTTDSRELHNSYYEKNKSKGFTGGVSHGTISAGYGKSQSTYDEKSTINAKSNFQVGDGSVLNRGAEITATNFEYGNIQINNGDVKYGARIDTRDVHTSSKSSGFTISAGINSPIKDRIKQAAGAVSQVKNGDAAGGAMEAVNAVTGTIKGLADNQGTRQTNYVNGSVGAKGARDAQANSNFYANIGVNAGFTRSQSSSSSHTEGAAVTTLKPMNENSSITYNNVNNITYQGTQAQGGTFIYNNVANIQKEAVELHNSYSSSSSSRGINAGATIGYGHKIQTTGNGGSISTSRSNQNTVETVYANGNFKNVNEVHNNTGSMVLNGFNQEGGKLTGNIGKVEVVSRQNTSTTTGSSSGMSLGISANGVPSSVNINGSRTNGDRAFVDNQSTFIVGNGSSLHVGTLENTGAVVGKEGNSTFKIDSYVGKDIQNHDTMKTTGGSLGISTGKPRITNVGFNQDSRDKQGITRNTVVGDVEIAGAEGSQINRDLGKANEVTRDTHSSTNINVESQTIEYLTNPAKLKEDIGKAKDEIEAVGAVAKAAFNTIGSKEKNGFLDFLRTERVQETVRNLGYIDTKGKTKEQIAQEMQDKYGEIFAKNGKKLEINFYVNSEVSQDDPNAKNKMNAAGFVAEDGSIWLNADNISSVSNFNLNSVFGHELTHNVTGKDTELLANFGEARASGFIEKAMDKGYLARTGGGLNWNSETLTREQKDRLASYQDIEEKLKISNYLRIYRSAKQNEVVHSAEDNFIEVGKDMNLISKLEKEIQDKLGIKSYNLPNSIKSLDLEGKELLAKSVTGDLQSELQNKLTDYKNASGDNKKKIGEEIIQKYGISNSDLATAEKNIPEIIRGTILKSSNAENNLKEILNNKNLNDDEKVKEIGRKFGISVTIEDLKNNSQISQDIIKNASLERIVAQDTDKIANKMRWESQFFKDFYANTQKLTNRPLVIDEDDFVWYAGNDGKLSSSQIVWEKGKVKSPSAKHSITGKVAFINENYMYKGEDKAEILNSWNGEPEIKNSNETFDTKVWDGKNYTSENNLIERVIKDQNTIFVRNTPGNAYVNSVSPKDAVIDNGIEGKGSDSILGIDYHIDKYKNISYKVYDGIDKKTGLIKVRDQDETFIPYVAYSHELNHGSHNQEGINEVLTPHYQIYRDGNGIHFSGERKFEVPVLADSLDDFYNKIINNLKNKNFTAYNKEGKIDTVHSEILKKLEDKNSDYYKFFRIELEEKMNKAKKNSQTTVNLNIPFFDYPTNKEEINTTGIKGSKYEKSSTPNSTEVKTMINHGKENLKRGVY